MISQTFVSCCSAVYVSVRARVRVYVCVDVRARMYACMRVCALRVLHVFVRIFLFQSKSVFAYV